VRFDVITLFPELFGPHLTQGITRRAFEAGQVDVRLWPLRDFAEDNYRRVDDRPYGGGPGMVMLAEPLERALAEVRADQGDARLPIIHFSPTGRRIDQALVQEMAAGPGAVLLCGRYEGIDQRVIDRHVDIELSLGDFVLSGGELPAMALLDAIARLQPGVLSDAASHEQDSFSDGLLDCPHYSRPELLRTASGDELPVPPMLLSGNHAHIARWRRDRALEITARRRPELITVARADGKLSKADEKALAALGLSGL
jgi:tRNA (guanine37-N1)-methyltransferase